jgi:hypothetical protein
MFGYLKENIDSLLFFYEYHQSKVHIYLRKLPSIGQLLNTQRFYLLNQ